MLNLSSLTRSPALPPSPLSSTSPFPALQHFLPSPALQHFPPCTPITHSPTHTMSATTEHDTTSATTEHDTTDYGKKNTMEHETVEELLKRHTITHSKEELQPFLLKAKEIRAAYIVFETACRSATPDQEEIERLSKKHVDLYNANICLNENVEASKIIEVIYSHINKFE